MQIFIRPADTLFFRSGLPFDAGQDAESESNFPPFPRTVYGALRTAGILSAGGGFDTSQTFGDEEAYGDRHMIGKFQIKGPLLVHRISGPMISDPSYIHYFPMPYDVAMDNDTKQLLHLAPAERVTSGACGWDLDIPTLEIMAPKDGTRTKVVSMDTLTKNYYLPDDNLEDYLTGSMGDGTYDQSRLNRFAAGKFFTEEARTGIATDTSSRTIRASRLYRVNHFRLQDTGGAMGLWVELKYQHNTFPKEGFIKLGGESRPASYAKIHLGNGSLPQWICNFDSVHKMVLQTGRFKAVLVTPGLFGRGSLPDVCRRSGDQMTVIVPNPSGDGVKFVLCGYCSSSGIAIGGWDIQKKYPKPMSEAVPAGSVYFFKVADQDVWNQADADSRKFIVDQLMSEYHYQSWCNGSTHPIPGGQDPAREGFGLTLIGGW